jgi:hypothetical protein
MTSTTFNGGTLKINMAMKITMVRKILIGIYILLVLGFVAKAEAGENGQKVSKSSVEVGPFSF